MSELNIYHHELRPDEYDEFYLKSEADAVIAELKKEKQYVIENTAKVINAQEREIRHQKYKRCLDKAKLCKLKRIDAADYRIPRKKWEFYDKWLDRWLELAEKFKDKEAK